MGLVATVIEESATEEGDGGTRVAFFLRGLLGLGCISVGDAGLFLGPLAGVEAGVAIATTGGSDEGPGVGSRAFRLALPLAVVVGGLQARQGGRDSQGAPTEPGGRGPPPLGFALRPTLYRV